MLRNSDSVPFLKDSSSLPYINELNAKAVQSNGTAGMFTIFTKISRAYRNKMSFSDLVEGKELTLSYYSDVQQSLKRKKIQKLRQKFIQQDTMGEK